MYNFIQTDKSKKPKDRFFEILNDYFSTQDYIFLKSHNGFVQNFELGKREINASFISTFGAIHDVQFFMFIIFNDLEKIFKKAVPKYGWTNWTISENLNCIETWLCDEDTWEYTDVTLNNSAKVFFENIKPNYDKIITEYNNYRHLEHEFNKEPSKRFWHGGRHEKRIINGLLLRKYHRKDLEFELLKQEYLDTMKNFKDCDENEVLNAIKYIESHDHDL